MRSDLTLLFILCAAMGHAQFEKAEAGVRKALAKDKPYQVISLSERALTRSGAPPIFHILRADGFIRIGEYDKAYVEAEQARSALGATPEFRSQLIGIHLGKGNIDSALRYVREPDAIVGDPEHLYRAGGVFLRKQDATRAMEYFDLGVRTYPSSARLLRERGACHALLGDSAKARVDFDKAIELAPRDAVNYNSRGFYRYLHFGDAVRAKADFTKAIKQDPNYGFAFSNRGWCEMKLGNMEKARSDLHLAIRKNPGNPYAHRNLGILELETGDQARGCAELRKALELGFTAMYGNEVEALVVGKCPASTPVEAKPLIPLHSVPQVPPSNAPGGPPPNKSNAP